MPQRFSYVKYDEISQTRQESFKKMFEEIEVFAQNALPEGRAKDLFFNFLEIAYMWTGKAIRDEQISRDVQAEHVPERTTE